MIHATRLWGGRLGLMVESWTHNPKVESSSLGTDRDCEGVNVQHFFNTMTDVPLSKALNPQLLPGRSMAAHCSGCVSVCSRCVCVFTAVCVLWMD